MPRYHALMAKSRILVVDDYPGARYRRMRVLMDDGGYEVLEEMLGREAVRRTSAEGVDLVLVDLHLPDISGLDVCRALKAAPATAGLPVILISAVADEDEAADQAREAGAVGFLPDSVDAPTLVETVRAALLAAAPQA